MFKNILIIKLFKRLSVDKTILRITLDLGSLYSVCQIYPSHRIILIYVKFSTACTQTKVSLDVMSVVVDESQCLVTHLVWLYFFFKSLKKGIIYGNINAGPSLSYHI